jgi:hypothetical protein
MSLLGGYLSTKMVSLRYNICERVKIGPSEIKEGAAACGNCSAWCGK